MTAGVGDTIAAVWRIESARIVAGVARIVRDVGLAEELAQDALVAALERWPQDGVPDRPGAWLLTTARHRAFDLLRRDRSMRAKLEQIGLDLEAQQALTGSAWPELDFATLANGQVTEQPRALIKRALGNGSSNGSTARAR